MSNERDTSGRILDTRLGASSEEVPLPPVEYMRLVCGDQPELARHFLELGHEVRERLRDHGMLEPGGRFLDVGCGCGRIARQLLGEPLASYVGFDRHPGMIEWCRRHLASRDVRLSFLHVDLVSSYRFLDGHQGRLDPLEFMFPFKAASFDSVLLASVFTHMPMAESAHYLAELRRVLAPDGRILLTVFFARGSSHSDESNFFYEPSEFLGQVERSGFRWRPLANQRQGSLQNWFELTAADHA